MKRFGAILLLALASCDDNEDSAPKVTGGGGGGTPSQTAYTAAAEGSAFNTLSSEFGYVDDPAHGGSGDPGTTGNWYTGAGGAYIGGQDSQGVSLPLSTEIAIYGSEQAALGQSVQVTDETTGRTVVATINDVGPGSSAVARGVGIDLEYQTARQLGVPVNGSDPMTVQPLKQ